MRLDADDPSFVSKVLATLSGKQAQALWKLYEAKERGLTWKELAEQLNTHHGSASGLLSILHKRNLIIRLRETREGSKVYVLPQYVADRPFGSPRSVNVCKECGQQLVCPDCN